MPDCAPRLVDYHCHLDLYRDFASQVETCNRERIATLAVTTTPMAWPKDRETVGESRFVRIALGMHPQLIAQRGAELSTFEKYLPEARYVGEVGLDAGIAHRSSYALQIAVLDRILWLCAQAGGKVLSVHAARSTREVLRLIEKHSLAGRSTVVFHWFNGSASELAHAVTLGCYFSVNQNMLLKDSRRAVVARMPRSRLLTESDGPFVVIDGRSSEPRDVAAAVAGLASLFGVAEQEMQDQIAINLHAIESQKTVSNARAPNLL